MLHILKEFFKNIQYIISKIFPKVFLDTVQHEVNSPFYGKKKQFHEKKNQFHGIFREKNRFHEIFTSLVWFVLILFLTWAKVEGPKDWCVVDVFRVKSNVEN